VGARSNKTLKPKPKQTKMSAAAMKKFKKKPCSFCREKSNYKDITTLRKFISDRGKIRARRVTGACTQHQRQIAAAVKNSREMALLPYTSTAR
jgi:small subunit ribosomal protein S18